MMPPRNDMDVPAVITPSGRSSRLIDEVPGWSDSTGITFVNPVAKHLCHRRSSVGTCWPSVNPGTNPDQSFDACNGVLDLNRPV